ncbi:MAG: LptF/LptG family permease [Phycisphaeraceae bacterium]|nr:MAG: LptF/LptG family permease [Phycisphaeraceae bacterium]
MSLLDRYIARQFIVNVVVLFVILFCFVVTVDVSINLDRFNRVATRLAATDGGEAGTLRHVVVTILVILDLWWPRLLQLFNFLLGLVMVGALGFTCTQILRHREFLAMVSAGQSLHRVLRPILVAAVALTAVQAVNEELIVPHIAPLLPRQHDEAGQPSLDVSNVPLMPDGERRLLYAREFDPAAGELRGVFIIETDEAGRAIAAVRAGRAVWDGEAWNLEDATVESRRLDEPAPTDYPTRLVTGVSPTRLRMQQYKGYREALSFRQIGQLLSREDMLDAAARAEYHRLRWGRFSIMLSNLLSLVIAAPFFITRLPTGVIMRTITCSPIAVTALIGGVFGASAAIPGIPPVFGVFLPPLILLPIAIAAFGAIKT